MHAIAGISARFISARLLAGSYDHNGAKLFDAVDLPANTAKLYGSRMPRPRLIRGLRIAWSVWWGILCVLLVVLWARSQSSVDLIGSVVTHRYEAVISTWPGSCAIRIADDNFELKPWAWRSNPVRDKDRELLGSFHWPDDSVPYLILPYWLLVLLSTLIASLPW